MANQKLSQESTFSYPKDSLNLAAIFFTGYVHTKPDKFENATFALKTDKMFSVHINRFQTVSLSTLKRCHSPRTLARQSLS